MLLLSANYFAFKLLMPPERSCPFRIDTCVGQAHLLGCLANLGVLDLERTQLCETRSVVCTAGLSLLGQQGCRLPLLSTTSAAAKCGHPPAQRGTEDNGQQGENQRRRHEH